MSTICIRNATVVGHSDPVSVVIADGKLTKIESGNTISDIGTEHTIIDAQRGLILPGFVDAHTHLDKAYAGTQDSGKDVESIDSVIQHMRKTKASFTVDNVHDRAVRAIQNHVRHGCTRIRTHVDVDTLGGLIPLKGVCAANKTCQDIATVEVVAFPQEGIYRDKGTQELLIEALDRGADVIGGIPMLERTEQDQHAHIDFCLELAAEHNVPVDMHIDETDNPNARSLEYLAARSLEMGLDQPITASHACALASYDSAHAGRVINLVAEADIDVITNPATNLMHQGGYDTYPKRRGLTRVDELTEAGITVAAAQDNVGDGFYPYGRGDMIEIAMLASHALQLIKPEELSFAIDLVCKNAAAITEFKTNDITTGSPATINLFPPSVTSVGELIRSGNKPRLVLHRGQPVAKNTLTSTLEPAYSVLGEL